MRGVHACPESGLSRPRSLLTDLSTPTFFYKSQSF